MLRYGSLFAGVGGFDLGFERAGFRTVWQVEIEPFCRRILDKHFPNSQRFADVRECGAHNLERVDAVTAGVPCQDVSIAGRRAGLAGERTGLFYEFARVLRELRPTWFVFENVPGLFSSNQGRDFAEVLRVLMVECGYGVSWRVLDSRYFNVAQRRERVFIVGCFGKSCPAEILFESESGTRDSQASGAARQDIAVPLTSGSGVTGSDAGRRCEDDFNLVTGPLQTGFSRGGHGHAGINQQAVYARHIVSHALGCPTSTGRNDPNGEDFVVAYALREDPGGIGQGHNTNYVSTPPDADRVRDFAGLPKGMDSPRYRGLGNAVTETVAEWIARRIAHAETAVLK